LDVFLDLFFSFFREATRWEKLQRSIYLSEEIPKVVVPRKRTDLVKQCTQGSSKNKEYYFSIVISGFFLTLDVPDAGND